MGRSLQMQDILGLLTVKAESPADGFSFSPPLTARSQHGAELLVPTSWVMLALPAPVPTVLHGAGSGRGHDSEAGATTGPDAGLPLACSFGASQERTLSCCPTGRARITFPQQDQKETPPVLCIFSSLLLSKGLPAEPNGKPLGVKTPAGNDFHPGDEGAVEKLQEGPSRAWAPPGLGGDNPQRLLAEVAQHEQEQLPRDPRQSFASS